MKRPICPLCAKRPYVLRGLTGLQELQTFLQHLRRRHAREYTMNDALRLRAQAEKIAAK